MTHGPTAMDPSFLRGTVGIVTGRTKSEMMVLAVFGARTPVTTDLQLQ